MIFVFNEWNEITAYLKLRRPLELANILSFCLDDFGQRLTHFQHDDLEQTIKLRVYQTQAKNPVERSGKQPYKMHLIDEKDLQTNYFPGRCIHSIQTEQSRALKPLNLQGIRLTRVTSVKLSLDSKHFLIFDSLNLNLLEFDLSGRFTRIVLKAEERLGQVLAFDFNESHSENLFVYRDSSFFNLTITIKFYLIFIMYTYICSYVKCVVCIITLFIHSILDLCSLEFF